MYEAKSKEQPNLKDCEWRTVVRSTIRTDRTVRTKSKYNSQERKSGPCEARALCFTSDRKARVSQCVVRYTWTVSEWYVMRDYWRTRTYILKFVGDLAKKLAGKQASNEGSFCLDAYHSSLYKYDSQNQWPFYFLRSKYLTIPNRERGCENKLSSRT